VLNRVMSVSVLSFFVLAVGMVRGDGFTDPGSWTCFDVTELPLDAQGGYGGVVVACQYAYLTPARDAELNWSGEFLRLDMSHPDGFDDPGAWLPFDVGDSCGLGDDGYNSGIYDGSQYVYFAPWNNGNGRRVLRFDTLASGGFSDCVSWAEYHAATAAGGYFRATFDGRYVYFAPYGGPTPDQHDEVLRYDTTAVFSDAGSWATFDPGAAGVGTDPDGYSDAFFDGHYVYFSPTWNGSAFHSEVLRLDTVCAAPDPFLEVTCWNVYDAATHPDTLRTSYREIASDGEYLYFAPATHGEVLRYRLACGEVDPFHEPSCWAACDPDVGTNQEGYGGAFYDGRFVYFAPTGWGPGFHGEVLRFDTEGTFCDSQSWDTFDFDPYCDGTNCSDPDGYNAIFSDGIHLYFVPGENRSGGYGHGEVLRYDTTWQSIPTVSEWGMIAMTLLMLTAGTLVFMNRRPATA